ncbi:MAG: acetyl-CoA hydrolase [Clostridiales bacterium]|nr:acetyl-CoA hydrolase [Clostridiales bacterium]
MNRIRNDAVRAKVTTVQDAASYIKNGMTVAASGFTAIGYPKAIPAELARRAEAGEELGITLITGGNVGDQLDGVLARAGVLRRRYGYQSNKDLRTLINADQVKYVDTHVSHVPYMIKNGYLGKIDVAVLEVAGVDEEGRLISTCALGINDVLAQYAEKIILEVNVTVPPAVEGMHDVFTLERAPHTQIIPIIHPDDRIGSPYIPCDPDKIVAVVYTDQPDVNQNLKAPDADMEAIADHIIEFLKAEIREGRLPDPLPPFQSGVGGVANAVLMGLAKSNLTNLTVYTEVMQDAVVALIDSGQVKSACGTALTISPAVRDDFYARLEEYKSKIILRPQEISNSPEVIRRLGVIAMNTAIEADLAGNVNSTHINGVSIMNGLGGSGDYTRNSGLSIFSTASTAKGGTISCIVPHVTHVDHTEHDTEILVTEQGLADLRGLTAYERADLIIEKCAHPKFRPELREYIRDAKAKAKALHGIL